MASTVTSRGKLELQFLESTTLDLGTAKFLLPVLREFDLASGTGDNTFDMLWSDTRTLTATSETLDLSGSLTSALGVSITFVEVGFIYIYNKATAAASVLLVGNGAAPAYAGFLSGGTVKLTVGASGFQMWYAPLDGGGLTVTNTTAQDLKIDAGAATITYDIILVGRSA